MPDNVIVRVSEFGHCQGMPKSLTFADRTGRELLDNPIDIDDDQDSKYTDSDDS